MENNKEYEGYIFKRIDSEGKITIFYGISETYKRTPIHSLEEDELFYSEVPITNHKEELTLLERVYSKDYKNLQSILNVASKYIVKYYKLLLDKSDIAKVYLSNTYLSNNYIKIKCGIYTYQQLKDKYESYLLDNFGIKWNNRTIGKYFPDHIKKDVHKNKITQKMYIFKKEL